MQSDWQPSADGEVLYERALMLKNIRAFFDTRGVIEVETPLLSQYATTDPNLDSLKTVFQGQQRYLNTSPEYAMKRILATWEKPIYQICKAFRDDELGINHNPEFTLLEWYRPGFDMYQLMDELAELVSSLYQSSTGRVQDQSALPMLGESTFQYISYRQAFFEAARLDPHQCSAEQCCQVTRTHDIEIPLGLTVDDDVDQWLDWLLIQLVLPSLSQNNFTFLYDYPVSQCALARVESDESGVAVARRFELFFGELELANGFYELTDAAEQLRRFERENVKRESLGKTRVDIDKKLIAALENGLPECAGVALGLDRLLMLLTSASTINEVISYSWSRA